MKDRPVPRHLVGEAGPGARPGPDPELYGSVTLSPRGPVEVRSAQTFTLVYTVGRLGLDDSGAIRVGFRLVGDFGSPQVSDPRAPNYTTASCSGSGRIRLSFERNGGQRPYNKVLIARLAGGYLAPGERIEIVFGDTREGSPGMIMQTYAEAGFEFRVAADVVATGHFVPLAEVPVVEVVPGPAARWRAVLPSLRRPGEPFRLGIKAEDRWGNPTGQARGRLRLVPTLPVAGLPEVIDYPEGRRSLLLEGLRVEEEGVLRIRLLAGEEETEVAEAGPLLVRCGEVAGYWGDLHGQSGETVGTTSVEGYFHFARDLAFLDLTSHQGNDFQINDAFWRRLNEVTAEYHQPGRFVTFPGYEWSGNTPVGGDRNVFFRHEGRPIRRSSHALLEDPAGTESDATDARQLFAALAGEDCVVYAHVGGRYADIAYAHDARLETALELHSAWGTFEWLLTDSFRLGYRCGVVCNSDGHKGRPGASHPGSSTFGAYGGLTCFLAPALEREAIFECLRRRHHYGTTGCRMHIDLEVAIPGGGTLYERDPSAFDDPPSRPCERATMGDIVRTAASEVHLTVRVLAAAPIERIEIRNGERTLETFRPYTAEELGARVRVVWSGAEYRGRGRNTLWRGRARFHGATIRRFAPINAWNPERLLEQRGSDTVLWESVTTGNFAAFDTWLEEGADSVLEVRTNRGDLDVPLRDLGLEDVVLEAGGLARRLRVFRLPETNPHREVVCERRLALDRRGDNPLWICVTTEDGHQAWTSPVFLFA